MSRDETSDHLSAHQQELHGERESYALCDSFGWDEKSENQIVAKAVAKKPGVTAAYG